MRQDYVCAECGHEYDELGDGKCYACGGAVIPIDEVGQEEPQYPEDLMRGSEEEGPAGPEELEDWEEPKEEPYGEPEEEA